MISVCIATCLRPRQLADLLQDLSAQRRLPDEVVVVDNDPLGSARTVVENHMQHAPFVLRYAVQPIKNISLTRNVTVSMASGDWLLLVDDDERAPPEWLSNMIEAAQTFAADGVLGPVEPLVPDHAANWIRRGRFYHWPHLPTGSRIPPNQLRLGNALIRASLLQGAAPPFDPSLGLTGGEDGDMLARLSQQGARLVWCDEAPVYEPVDASRLSLKWLLRRALRGGQDFARHQLAGRYQRNRRWQRTRLFFRASVQMIAAALLALASWPLGRHRAAFWLLKATANLGKLSMLWGYHYREYA